jgi:hypothetical protein
MQPRPDFGEQTYQGHNRLQGKVALITGGDSGIGRAVAVAFAKEGADVVISYKDEHEDAEETARVVRAAGRQAILIPGDIQGEDHCQQLVQRTTSELGKLDILVNNAAFQKNHQSIQEITAEELDITFRTNIYAMFFLCKAALKVMPAGGSIINTSSVEAYQPDASLIAYASTKGAIVNFTKALSEEAIKQGIRVNTVAPGPVWTPFIPATMPEEQVTKFGQDSPIGRTAQPVELAPIFVLLASTESSYVTGQVYGVTGGTFLA